MKPEISIIHTTHDRLPDKLRRAVIAQLQSVKPDNAELIIVSESKQEGGDRNHLIYDEHPESANFDVGLGLLYHMVLLGLEQSRPNTVVFPHIEADCLYPEGFFDNPYRGDGIGYKLNKWRMNSEGAFPDSRWPSFSGCVGDHLTVITGVEKKLDAICRGEKVKWCEPCNKKGQYLGIWNERPYIDVRWGGNLTGNRKGDYRPEIPYWGSVQELQKRAGLI